MELDWSTFILEIINFVILVWLLKHFFYKPIMNIIAKRKQAIQDSLDKADAVQAEAESLKSKYENRLEDWEKEKAASRAELHRKIEEEKKQAMENLAQSIQQEKEKAQVLLQRQQENTLRKNERLAIEQSVAFVTRLLSRFANPELEATIIHIVLEDLHNLPPRQLEELQKACAKTTEPFHISSAYKVEKEKQTALKNTLTKILKHPIEVEFKRDPALLAGIHIDIGAWNLQASLKEELKYFAEIQHNNG